MKDVVSVWQNNKHLYTEVRDYLDDLVVPIVKVVWDQKKGEKAPSLDEAIALFDSLAQDDGIN